MKRPLILLVLVALSLPALVFAQHEFRASGSGVWCDNRNWVTSENGVWLIPQDGVFPGERHNRNSDVTIDDGSAITINEGEELHVNSLTVIKGCLTVNGTLVVGSAADDAADIKITEDTTDRLPDDRIYIKSISVPVIPKLELQQNVPNPVFSSVSSTTNFSFYLDKEYSLVTLTVYDQMGRVIRTLYSEYGPAAGWKKISMNTQDLSSGSYPVVLQAGHLILHTSMAIIK